RSIALLNSESPPSVKMAGYSPTSVTGQATILYAIGNGMIWLGAICSEMFIPQQIGAAVIQERRSKAEHPVVAR
ncbi:hypothetical protein ACLIKM_004321, partial [Escherichia coli]